MGTHAKGTLKKPKWGNGTKLAAAKSKNTVDRMILISEETLKWFLPMMMNLTDYVYCQLLRTIKDILFCIATQWSLL